MRCCGIDDQPAVLVEPALGHLVDDAGRPRRELHHVAVAADQRLRHADLAGERGVLGEMQRFAVDRNRDARPHPAIEVLELGAARMAGDMDQVGAVGDHLDALRRPGR